MPRKPDLIPGLKVALKIAHGWSGYYSGGRVEAAIMLAIRRERKKKGALKDQGFCGQCGDTLEARACGPTHAAVCAKKKGARK